MPKVSVIIPTYNSEKFLDKTIQSVFDQTYKDWELIIVDDVSRDGTREIITRWSKNNDKIIPVFLDKNSGGPAHPKNIGFEKATGKYIAYLDHDDIWLPKKLEKQIAVLEQSVNIGMISCEGMTIDENDNITDKIVISKVPTTGVYPSILYTDFIASNSSIVIPRDVIVKVGKRDDDKKIGIAEDREFEMRVASHGYVFSVVHEPLFKYRVHSMNTSRQGSTQGLNYAEANFKFIEYYKKYNSEYIVFNRFAREYLKLGRIDMSKKYIRLTLSQRKDYGLMFMYLLLFLGKNGIKFGTYLLSLRTKILYK
jgi:glycosyltransferase involved in cell wall biosynthesis